MTEFFSNFGKKISNVGQETCKRFLKEQRWGDDVVCPYCGHHHCRARSNGQFRCLNCLNNFSVLVGTIFENTKIALVKWFSVMYLISSHKKGISSHQLARDINVTQKTAWHILHKVRIGEDNFTKACRPNCRRTLE